MSTDHHMNGLQDVALRAARAAGRIQAEHFGRVSIVTAFSSHDVTLEVDLQCEERIIQILKEAFPDHGLISEECGSENADAEFVWIIDPLDGSVNYHHGIAHFCVSIACYCRNGADNSLNPLLGLVYAPVADEMVIGTHGRGAFLNGKPIRARSGRALAESVIGISFGSREQTICRMERLNAVLVRKARKVRIFGSTALDLAGIACGRISGLVQGGVRNWDFAAARIVLEQSGGRFEARAVGANRWEIVASESGIFDDLKHLIATA